MSFVHCLMMIVLTAALASANASDDKPAPRSSKGKGGLMGNFGNETMDIAAVKREYRLVAPKSIEGKGPVPLVFAFHGFLIDSKDVMPIYSKLDALAEDKGFVLVFPNGRNRSWPLLVDWAKADLAFFDALYDQITARYDIDLDRVYLAGMSNGAYFSHLVATQRSDKIAALASHSGGVGLVGFVDPKLERKYAVVAIHGADDSIVKVDEGRRTRDIYKKWGHPVEYVEVPRHNHFWATNVNINAKIWTFFMEHPLRSRE